MVPGSASCYWSSPLPDRGLPQSHQALPHSSQTGAALPKPMGPSASCKILFLFLQTGDRELAALATLPSLEQLDILGNRLYPPVLSWEINHDIHCQTDNIQMSPIHIYIFLFFLFEVIPLVIYQECISDSSPGAGGFSAKSQTVGLLFL